MDEILRKRRNNKIDNLNSDQEGHVSPTVEVIWSPSKKKHVLKSERIQRIATKMVTDLEELT